MGENNYNLSDQYEQDIKNLLFCVKNILKNYENEKPLDLDINNLKVYYENLLNTQQRIAEFHEIVDNSWKNILD